MKNDGWTLQNVSKELKNDKEVVIEAVKNDRRAYQFASEDLQKDEKLKILLHCKKNEETI